MKYCIECNKELIIIKDKNKKFCNNKCQQEYHYKKNIEKWKSGIHPKGGAQIRTYIRKYLFEKFNNKCSKCGWCEINPVTNKCPLEVEHIDGNSNNHTEENLTLLCPNCHSLTTTYKALNKGKGRMQRMKRYREGKTF
jgi:hypothetical protein